MNSFETDLKRAIVSKRFLMAVVLESMILIYGGPKSSLFFMSVPILSSLPFSYAWLSDLESGFLKLYLIRTNRNSYVAGKIFASAISGGLVLLIGGLFYQTLASEEVRVDFHYMLFFLNGMLWATISTCLVAWVRSYCIVYGGGFVCFYFLVILQERFLTAYYCINPKEWILPLHTWTFNEKGIYLMLGCMLILLFLLYNRIIRRWIDCF